MELAALEKKYGKTIKDGGQRFRRFIPYPNEVTDDTLRCIRCGQIDEPELHIRQACIDALADEEA